MENKIILDLPALTGRLLKERKTIIRWCIGSVIAALVVGFSIPKEYRSKAKIAPEYTTRSSSSSITALMSSFAGASMTRDAVYPELYPDIISSTSFITGMFDIPVQVHLKDSVANTTLYDFMLNHQKHPWWTTVLTSPFRLMGKVKDLLSDEDDEEEDGIDAPVDNYRLTRKQMFVVSAIKKRVSVLVDKKTYVVTLSVTMQDKEIAASVATALLQDLQDYITNYRTDKSRQTLEYTRGLYEKAQKDYFEAQQAYASYMDSHQNVKQLRAKAEGQRLEDEMNLEYQLYSKLAQQLQAAEAKVLEETPVYTIMQAPSVPIRRCKPSKSSIMLVFLLLGLCISSSWVLWGRDFVAQVKSSR